MTNRRSFLAALLAVPMAAAHAMSKVVHGPRFKAGDVIPVKAADARITVRELWINLDSPHGVYYSIDGGPLVKTAWPLLPAAPLRIELPPWVQGQMPTVTFEPVSDEPFAIYGWHLNTPEKH